MRLASPVSRCLLNLMLPWVGEWLKSSFFGESEVTSDPYDDLKQATKLARTMVPKFGKSKELGLVTHNYDDYGKSMSTVTRLLIV
ncbi:hypothetical protein FXO38_19601 [Capsicum annuum]|nr:hypothetical protein FXO37_36389 [Capsicum annuum]KAF3645543.1 hypothetical protein FXO38_19601 [Capsicum annuum]